jgi:prepilin peptidase CpaA
LLPNTLKALLALIVVVAAIFDVRWRRVPNWLTFPGLMLGIALNTLLLQSEGLWSSLEGLGLAILVYFPLYLLRGMGGGDVKLMAAVGAIAGPANWLRIFLFTLLFGAAAAVILILSKRRVRRTLQNIGAILMSLGSGQAPYQNNPQLDVRRDEGARLPHAMTIACGTLVFLIAQAAGVLH